VVVHAPAASLAKSARRPSLLVLADGRAIAIFALRPQHLMLADARAIAIFAYRSALPMVADGRALAGSARRPLSLVLADVSFRLVCVRFGCCDMLLPPPSCLFALRLDGFDTLLSCSAGGCEYRFGSFDILLARSNHLRHLHDAVGFSFFPTTNRQLPTGNNSGFFLFYHDQPTNTYEYYIHGFIFFPTKT